MANSIMSTQLYLQANRLPRISTAQTLPQNQQLSGIFWGALHNIMLPRVTYRIICSSRQSILSDQLGGILGISSKGICSSKFNSMQLCKFRIFLLQICFKVNAFDLKRSFPGSLARVGSSKHSQTSTMASQQKKSVFAHFWEISDL